MNQKITIAINREYGSGGRMIGEMLADDLGIHYYDKEILKLAADDSGINESLFINAEELKGRAALFRAVRSINDGELIPPESTDYTSERNLFNYHLRPGILRYRGKMRRIYSE